MVDVRRGILENHVPHRGTSGMSDTVKEAIKLFEQNKRTGIAVPFRTAILPPGFDGGIPPPHRKGGRPIIRGGRRERRIRSPSALAGLALPGRFLLHESRVGEDSPNAAQATLHGGGRGRQEEGEWRTR